MDSASVVSNYTDFAKLVRQGDEWTPMGEKQAEYKLIEDEDESDQDISYEIYKVILYTFGSVKKKNDIHHVPSSLPFPSPSHPSSSLISVICRTRRSERTIEDYNSFYCYLLRERPILTRMTPDGRPLSCMASLNDLSLPHAHF